MRTRQLRLARAPESTVGVGDFVVHDEDLTLAGGQFLVRNSWLSVDASTMLRVGGGGGSYLSPLQPGEPIEGWAVGRVVETRSDLWAVGERVLHNHGWRDHTLFGDSARGWGSPERLPQTGAPDEHYLGALGPTGLTAWAGLLRVAELRDGDVVLVSAAGGAVGSLAVQLAALRGHRVVASTGSPEKADLVRRLGADIALDHRAAPLGDQLAEAVPDGVDVYFDNVGGDHLEAALRALRPGGRVALCGAVSGYGPGSSTPGPRNLFDATAKGLTLRGFLARMHVDAVEECRREMGALLDQGRLQVPMTVRRGLEQAPEALLDLMAGRSSGKVVVRLDH